MFSGERVTSWVDEHSAPGFVCRRLFQWLVPLFTPRGPRAKRASVLGGILLHLEPPLPAGQGLRGPCHHFSSLLSSSSCPLTSS